jgi:hypothetical protein
MKKKMINAVTSSHSEPICITTTVSVKENEINTIVDSETNVETSVETSVTTDAIVAVVVENAEPPVVEKKKRGRKKLIKPDLSNTNALINSADIVDPSAPPPVVVHKKRGRKPRGGKIIQETLVHNNNVPELPNIILHLKCVTSDLNTANNESIIASSSETSVIKHENEIMCYNDQTVCGSEVCNYTDSSSTDSVDSDSPIRSMTIYETDNINNNNKTNMHTLYDPSTFANCCSATSTCDSSSSSQLFTEWKDKHKQNYQHDDSTGSENNATMKDIWKKISQLKISYNKNDTFQIIGSHRSACFWCTCDFDTPAIYIPKSMVKDTCNVYGCFCHPECAVAFLMNENIDTSIKFERYHLLNSMYGPIYNYDKSIKPAPNPYYLLNKFYGNLSIIEYRKLFKSEQLIYMVNKPLTHILPELYEDNNDFLVGNKIIQNNNIRKNQLKKKSNKTNIINEVFGVK